MMQFYTIGVFNSSEEEFFGKLVGNNIDVFADLRQLRAVRGPVYAFVNSNRLQARLRELKISYEYVQGLAPTKEIRQIQKQADARQGERIRDRQELAAEFADAYTSAILNRFDLRVFVDRLAQSGAERVVLFCVEEKASACHRSLVASRLQGMGFSVKHL